MTLAFAGAGWSAAVHGYAVERLGGLTITHVASRDQARAAEAARRLGAVAVPFDTLPAGADAVVVCTPPAHHAEAVLAALAAGASALVEKPLCTTLADADRLVEAAESGCVAYAENLLHAPVVRFARSHVADLDGVDLIEVRALQGRPTWGEFLTEGWGGGVLFDLGAHPLAVAMLLAAPARPVELRAVMQGADDHPVDEHAEVTIQLDTGCQIRVIASWRHTGPPTWDAQVSSPDGVVRLELLPNVLLERNGVEVRLPDAGAGAADPLAEMGYLAQMDSFRSDVATGQVPALGAAFGRAVLDLTCAAYASAGEGGSWVPLPFEGDRNSTPIQLWRR